MRAAGGKGRLNFLYSNALEAGKLMYISVGVDRERCRAKLRAFTHAYYGPQLAVDANCAFGPPEVCAARIQGFLDAVADRHARANLARCGAGEACCSRCSAALTVMQGQQ